MNMETTNAQMSAPEMLEIYGISTEDVNQLRLFSKAVDEHIDGLVEKFYVWLKALQDYEHFFTDDHIVERVKGLQKVYWAEFFRDERNGEYIEKRRMVGETHARIGLSLGSYCAAMNHMHSLIVSRLASDDSAQAALDIVAKFMNMDMAIVIETYSKVINESISAQSQALMEMSTPVTQIWEGILMLPVVGIIDSKRAQEIMATTLSKISETQAQVFIMDISGVAVIDTQVANHMIQITKATRLMGCESTISGLSPSIAETIVQLGIDVGKVRTTATLKDALSSAFRRIGMAIKEASDKA
jgi:rsbT co-antagonist protein RsbR